MKKPNRSQVVRGMLGLAAAAVLPKPSRAQSFTLAIGHVLEPQHSVHIGAVRFKEFVERESAGRITVNLFPSGMLGGSREMTQQMQRGAIFGVIDATAKFVAFVPEFGLLDMPFLANDAASAFKVMDSETTAHLIGEKSIKAGFRQIHAWEVGFRHIYTKRREIKSMSDLKGLKIRVIPSPTYINLFKAFGAAPTPMNFGELYTSLQQGVVDGAENDVLTYQSSKHYEVAPLLAMTRHMMLVNTFFVSEPIWTSMPADVRNIITVASLEARHAAMDDSDRRQLTAAEELKAVGVKMSEPDFATFADAAEHTKPWFIEKFSAGSVQAIAKAKD